MSSANVMRLNLGPVGADTSETDEPMVLRDCEAWYQTQSGFQRGSPTALTCRLSSRMFSTSDSSLRIWRARAQSSGFILRGSETPSMLLVVTSLMSHLRTCLSVEAAMGHIFLLSSLDVTGAV